MSRRRTVRTTLLAAVGLAMVVPVARAATATATAPAPTAFGFGATATANGATITYEDPSAPVPASPTAEGDADHTESAIQTGPVGRALASTAWPGALIAGAGPALGLLLPVNPGAGPYPVRAEAGYPQGKVSDSNTSVPGNAMSASATQSGVGAAASSTSTDNPAAVVQGSLASTVAESADASSVLAEGTATASNVTILGGVIHIDNVTSDAHVRSDGAAPVLSGQTHVTGMTVGGVPVTIDGNGARVGNGGTDAGGPTASAESVFRQAGVNISVAQPSDIVSASHAERMVGGVLITVDASRLQAFVASLPADTAKQVAGVLNLQQQLFIGIGSVDASVGTVSGTPAAVDAPASNLPTPGTVATTTPAPPLSSPAASTTPAVAAPAAPNVSAPPAAAATAPSGAPPATPSLPASFATRLAHSYAGLLPWDLAVAALLALAAAAPLWRLTNTALAAATVVDECPLETRRNRP